MQRMFLLSKLFHIDNISKLYLLSIPELLKMSKKL